MSNPGAEDIDDTEDTTAPPTDDIAPPTDDGSDAGPMTIATIQYDKDSGEFTLISGDEVEGDESDASEAGLSPAEGGAPAAPAGQTFTSPGPLLKAVLDLVKAAEDGGGADAQFDAGFNADKTPTPKG